MKNITKYITTLAFLSTQMIFAQSAQQVRDRIEGTERPIVPAQATGESPSSEDNVGNDVAVSDTGAQRPVQLNEKGMSSFVGYNSKYFFRSNPLSSSGELKQQATGMWTNTFFAGAGLGVLDASDAIITPYVGVSYTINDYIKSNLSSFNYNSTGAYALLLAQFGNGWSFRGGVSYSMDRSSENDTEDYMEIYPNVGVLKSYVVNDSTTAIFDASIGSHMAKTETITSDGHEDELSSIEYSASYALNYELMSFTIIPKYKISYKVFDEGINKNRDDMIHDINFKIEYPLSDSLKISTFYDYSTRNTEGIADHDFKSYDYGIILGLNARF
ncbi:MAG: hypothetical protein ACJZ64_00965 [Opitutales bacterium]